MIEVLFDRGAHTDSKDMDGRTSLILAIETGRADLVLFSSHKEQIHLLRTEMAILRFI